MSEKKQKQLETCTVVYYD